MPVSTDAAVTDVLPYFFRNVGQHRLVQFVDPARMDWRPGFFQMGLPAESPVASISALEEWYADTPVSADFSRTSAVFHVSRCGSTLLTQNFKATCEAIVLSEPPFMRLLRTLLDDRIDQEMTLGIVARTIGAWQTWAERRGRRLVVKFNSQAHLYRESLMGALPGARFLFLHREPVAVLESLERGPPPYLRRDSRQRAFRCLPELADHPIDPLLHAAASRYCGALEEFAGVSDPALACVAYPDLEHEWPAIMEHCGYPPAAASWNAVNDAKAANPADARPYRGVGAERLSQFASAHADLVAVARERYSAFLAATAQRCGKAKG